MRAFLLLFLILSTSSYAAVIDGIAARVGEQLILWSEVQRAQKSASLSSLGEGDLVAVRERLIEDILVAIEAGKLGRTVDELQVLQAIDRFAANNGLSRATLQASLSQQGVGWNDYQDVVRRQLLRAEVVQMRVRNTVAVGESDIESAYKERYRSSIEFDLLLEPVDKGDPIDFGWVKPAEIRDDIRRELAKGDAVGPRGEVELNELPYLVVVRSTRVVGGPGLDEVRAQIREEIFQERLDGAFQNWLSQVKGKAFIERTDVPEGLTSVAAQ